MRVDQYWSTQDHSYESGPILEYTMPVLWPVALYWSTQSPVVCALRLAVDSLLEYVTRF